jgi:4-amino-4-deoxy-L-arabinose transferase-like glycosyltransferase
MHCTGLTTRRGAAIALALVALGIVLRFALAAGSPRRDGYVWDEYDEGVTLLYRNGKLPASTDCWQCYHPPLYYYAALPFYWLGVKYHGEAAAARDPKLPARFICLLSALAGIAIVVFTWLTLRLYRCREPDLLLALGFLMVLPVLLFASWSTEADVLVAAFLTAFLYFAARYHLTTTDAASPWRRVGLVVLIAVMAGCAVATKYNGLVALPVFAVLALVRVARTRRLRPVVDLLAIVAIAFLIGGWKYVDNKRTYGTYFFANGSAIEGFSPTRKHLYWDRYEFHTLRLWSLLREMDPLRTPRVPLPELKSYESVWTTLHALAWSDMGMFTMGDRTGGDGRMYPPRPVPFWVVALHLTLALLPAFVALGGMTITLRRFDMLPLTVITLLTFAAYVFWFLPQPAWALKTKYLLFLLPAYLVFLLAGLEWLERRAPRWSARFARAWIWGVVAMSAIYLLVFAAQRVSAL